MASMFGGFGAFDRLGQGPVQGFPGPGGFGPSDGFPGVFPTAGPGNSGFSGFPSFPSYGTGTYGTVGPCTKEDVRTGVCVMGPRMEFLGKK